MPGAGPNIGVVGIGGVIGGGIGGMNSSGSYASRDENSFRSDASDDVVVT